MRTLTATAATLVAAPHHQDQTTARRESAADYMIRALAAELASPYPDPVTIILTHTAPIPADDHTPVAYQRGSMYVPELDLDFELEVPWDETRHVVTNPNDTPRRTVSVIVNDRRFLVRDIVRALDVAGCYKADPAAYRVATQQETTQITVPVIHIRIEPADFSTETG